MTKNKEEWRRMKNKEEWMTNEEWRMKNEEWRMKKEEGRRKDEDWRRRRMKNVEWWMKKNKEWRMKNNEEWRTMKSEEERIIMKKEEWRTMKKWRMKRSLVLSSMQFENDNDFICDKNMSKAQLPISSWHLFHRYVLRSMDIYASLHFEHKNDVTIIAKLLYRAQQCIIIWCNLFRDMSHVT